MHACSSAGDGWCEEGPQYVSVVNSMSVLGSGSGTVYIVLTTTSAVNGIVYKPVRAFTSRPTPPVRLLAFRIRLHAITLSQSGCTRACALASN